ncbi:MAG: beta-ketoacyl-ACP synthase II [Alphaproteobacteria bacterium]|nr:beta-ketoacyl-ACP synthase II [Alphaproteobacteria bacterium]
MLNSKRRVVVTGLGIVSPLGCDCNSVWHALISGRSGVRNIDKFDTSDLPVKIAGTIIDFNPDKYLEPKEQRKVDSFILYALAAATDAYMDSKLDNLVSDNVSVIIGSGIGGLQRLYDTSIGLYNDGPRRGVSPFFIPSVIGNMASGLVAIKLGLKGVNYCITSACASSTHAIGEAFHKIRDGYCDYALTGGAEDVVCRLGIAGFAAAKALSTSYNDNPSKASRPWDKDRDGFVIGQGAGVLILETHESAISRNATIYGEIIGYGASCDAYHMTSPDPSARGAVISMNNALIDADISPNSIDYINAHGTSTKLGDKMEIDAIKEVFGEYSNNINVSSTKSATGHLLGAAGAIEAIFSIKSLQDNVVPPTINLDNPDGNFDLNLTPNIAQTRQIDYVMSNSFGFGGTNGTLIFKKY